MQIWNWVKLYWLEIKYCVETQTLNPLYRKFQIKVHTVEARKLNMFGIRMDNVVTDWFAQKN